MKKVIVLADGRIIVASKIREIYCLEDYSADEMEYVIRAEYDNGDRITLGIVASPAKLGEVLNKIATFLVDDNVALKIGGEVADEQVQVASN